MTVKALANAEDALATIESDCATAAEDHEASMKSRAEELKAVGEAKEIIKSSTSGATEKVYSLLQTEKTSSSVGMSKASSAAVVSVHSNLQTHTDLVNLELVTMLKKLAKQQQSHMLAQLASRVAAAFRYGARGGEDSFAKIKEMITQLITKLESEGDADATQKKYCDTEMKETSEKKVELTAGIDKLTTKIDKASAKAAKLKEDVAELEEELGEITKMQAEMDVAREDEHSTFVKEKADLEQGIAGVQGAIKVLREYYGSASLIQQPKMPAMHTKAEGAGSSIIAILEVCESDFSKSLAEETIAEAEAQSTYDTVSMKNKMSKTMKEQVVKYKTKEAASLEKSISENSSDREGLQTELSAVLEYNEKLQEMCVAKPETYSERAGRRDAEIKGLKEALKFLEGEAFLQRRKIHSI